MADPTAGVRAVTYQRDQFRCVSCGALSPLEYQHRASEGMGGSTARPFLEEGLAACSVCNAGYEASLQARALANGWKVRRWVRDRGLTAGVPVFYVWERQWCELTRDGLRVRITEVTALRMMREVYGDQWDEMERAAA